MYLNFVYGISSTYTTELKSALIQVLKITILYLYTAVSFLFLSSFEQKLTLSNVYYVNCYLASVSKCTAMFRSTNIFELYSTNFAHYFLFTLSNKHKVIIKYTSLKISDKHDAKFNCLEYILPDKLYLQKTFN